MVHHEDTFGAALPYCLQKIDHRPTVVSSELVCLHIRFLTEGCLKSKYLLKDFSSVVFIKIFLYDCKKKCQYNFFGHIFQHFQVCL